MLDAKKYSSIRVKYQGNVLYSCSKRTAEENLEVAKKALGILLDIDPNILYDIDPISNKCVFEENDGVIEFYRAY